MSDTTMWYGPGAFGRCGVCRRLLLAPLLYSSRHIGPYGERTTGRFLLNDPQVCGDCARRLAKERK